MKNKIAKNSQKLIVLYNQMIDDYYEYGCGIRDIHYSDFWLYYRLYKQGDFNTFLIESMNIMMSNDAKLFYYYIKHRLYTLNSSLNVFKETLLYALSPNFLQDIESKRFKQRVTSKVDDGLRVKTKNFSVINLQDIIQLNEIEKAKLKLLAFGYYQIILNDELEYSDLILWYIILKEYHNYDIDSFVLHLIEVCENKSNGNDQYFQDNMTNKLYLLYPKEVEFDKQIDNYSNIYVKITENYPELKPFLKKYLDKE
jgi:hypothetical protein